MAPRRIQPPKRESLNDLLGAIRACTLCRDAPRGKPLQVEPRPVLQLDPRARILVAGQAPGTRVHASGKPFTDPSGVRLRDWIGIGEEVFNDPTQIAVVPMGFCFPGLDAHGSDLPPRRECRAHWHDDLFALAPQIETILVVGSHAQAYHLRRLGHVPVKGEGMTGLVRRWRDFAHRRPLLIPLPHPSWRNSGWLKRNPWFEAELLPGLRAAVREALE